MYFFTEAAKFLLVLCLNIVRTILGMKIVGHVFRFQSRRRKFLQRKLEQSRIVRLENQQPAWTQYATIPFQKCTVRKAALRMTGFRPRVAEIDIKAVDLSRREDFFQRADVEYQQSHVRQFCLTHPLRRLIKDILLRLDSKEVILRFPCPNLADETAFSRSKLYIERRRAAENFHPTASLRLRRRSVLRVHKIVKVVDCLINPRFSPQTQVIISFLFVLYYYTGAPRRPQ